MAGSNNIMRMPPRQRMINLMYIVLTAMLALNVSSDVLHGFHRVHDGLESTSAETALRNEARFSRLEALYAANPEKAGRWYGLGSGLQDESSALLSLIDSLKTEIAFRADGRDADVRNLKNAEDLEASSVVMLSPVNGKGKYLRERIDRYRETVASMIADSPKRDAIVRLLSTAPSDGEDPGAWERSMFDNMPAVAAVTLLSKIQGDVLNAQGEALASLIDCVDMGDERVNEMKAYVIPRSEMVMRGGRYSANVVLAAVDTTRRPSVFVGGKRLDNDRGLLEITATQPGEHKYSGYVEMQHSDGSLSRLPFEGGYVVMEPMATVSPTMMNVLYAGIDNPVSISVPGVPMQGVKATMTGGSLVRSGNSWIARPTQVGGEAEIKVSAMIDGREQNVGSMKFRVRRLPDPTPYLTLGEGRYKGAPRRISKGALMDAPGIGAAIDDGVLDVAFTVVSFSTIFLDQMGNAIPEVSDGSRFSSRQKEQFRRLKPGKSFFISDIKAKGPDGVTRDISPMQVALN